MDTLSEHFKKLNTDPNVYSSADINDQHCNRTEFSNSLINKNFTCQEIKDAVRTLKNNKSHGIDLVVNEFIKNTIDLLCPLYTKLFNLVLNTGILPESINAICLKVIGNCRLI